MYRLRFKLKKMEVLVKKKRQNEIYNLAITDRWLLSVRKRNR